MDGQNENPVVVTQPGLAETGNVPIATADIREPKKSIFFILSSLASYRNVCVLLWEWMKEDDLEELDTDDE
ncbi:unnamed protein product [Caenorhabditis nigoni]